MMKHTKHFAAALLAAFMASAGASSVVSTTGQVNVPFTQAGTGAVKLNMQDKVRERVSVKDFGAKCDGVTDDTATITAYFTANPTYRGTVLIPYGTKFNKATVYAAAPVGMILRDESSINTGQPPGYKNKAVVFYSNDTASDDSHLGVASAHHPAIRLNNTHTAASSSATGSYHSILFAHGYRWNNDPIDGMQYLTQKSSRGTYWRSAWMINTPLDYALNGAAQWTASTAYTVGAEVNTSDGNVYKATVAGTSGATKPTHTTGTATDGTVTWQYQGPWAISQTLFYFDEDGYGGINGAKTARWGAETVASRGISINVDATSGDTFVRDDQRGTDLWRLSTTKGLQAGAITSLTYGGALTGATPTLSSNFHTVTNSTATNMTNLVIPNGQTRAGPVCLYFTNANTTLLYSGGNFNLKSNTAVTPQAGAVMCFILEPSISGGWIEMSRNF